MAVSKKIRFEVFKRDGFICQYCGATPPKVVLECDHINPKAKGGLDAIDNLITSCFDCNRGKSANLLTSIPETIKSKSEVLKEKESQISEYNKLIKQKYERLENEVWQVIHILHEGLNTYPKNDFASIKKFIESLGLEDVIDSADIALYKGINNAKFRFKYFCGVCWSKIKQIDK